MPTIKLYQIMVRHEGGKEHYVRLERNEVEQSVGVMHVEHDIDATLFNGDDIENHVTRLNKFAQDEKDGDIYFHVNTPYVYNEDTGEIEHGSRDIH